MRRGSQTPAVEGLPPPPSPELPACWNPHVVLSHVERGGLPAFLGWRGTREREAFCTGFPCVHPKPAARSLCGLPVRPSIPDAGWAKATPDLKTLEAKEPAGWTLAISERSEILAKLPPPAKGVGNQA